ncbi:hypothetical protein BSZ39_02900 [Bowdeniella nasicola]|uniref:Lipoprotein n=1 Tax=Bowdeniella nasicola TaxID=208480 RepID=A0A1Q5Q4M8_9ACTO|nr:hypothetical protein [Bowdeniella nasicola]OKL54649.1 hypothetical protein BSZ39_02900 [Bowdeniella nasicola]
MRRSIIAAVGISLLALSACSASVNTDSPAPSSAAPSATASASESESPEATSAEPSTESTTSEASQQGGSSEVKAEEIHGKILLTSEAGPQDSKGLHGKIVVGQGGCISFVPVPGGGRPLPILAPTGSSYDGKDTVTIGSNSYRFGQVVDLEGIGYSGDEVKSAAGNRCDAANVMWLVKKG